MEIKDLKKCKMSWKETGKELTDRMKKNLIEGKDPSIINKGARWTEEDSKLIKEYMNERKTIDIDFGKLKKMLYRDENTVKEYIKKIYTKWERIEDASRFEIEPITQECTECKEQHIVKRIWKIQEICIKCYDKDEKKECIQNTWKRIEELSDGICEICKGTFESNLMNYDHKNIFNKNDSICVMIYKGESLEKILEEREKCRMICKECHEMITHLESRYGLIGLKKSLEEEEYEEYIERTRDLQDKIYKKVQKLKGDKGKK